MTKKNQNTLDVIYDMLRILLSYGITVYMGLVIVVLPLYFKQGYGYIATDKITFFCKMSVNTGKVLIPVLILCAITTIAINHAKILSFFRLKALKKVIKSLICKISALDFFVAMYGVAVIFSYLCSDYRESALWGAAGWYMGFVPQMILICSYFLIAKFWEPKKWMFYLILPVATVVFALGYLNRFGYYPIEMEYASSGYISTIGNINWYCGYVVPVLFAGIGLFWCASKAENQASNGIVRCLGNVALAIYIFLGFSTLITQGSASGLLALGVMMLVLFCLSAKSADRMRQFWIIALLLSMGCVGTMLLRNHFPEAITYRDKMLDFLTTGWTPIVMTIVSCLGLAGSIWNCKRKTLQNKKIGEKIAILCVTLVSCIGVVYVVLLTVNTINPGVLGKLSEYPLFIFSDKWGSNRGATWKIGMKCFLEQDFLHKLVGVGPDAMWAYIDAGSSDELLQLVQKNFGTAQRLTNAHNELLTILVNYGIIGLISFVGVLVSAVRLFLGNAIENEQSGNRVVPAKGMKNAVTAQIPVACGLGIFAHVINNIFSFQQVMNVTMLFLLLGMGKAFRKEAESPHK